MTPDKLVGYKEWKGTVPEEIRKIVEGQMLGKQMRIDKDDLPSVVEFYQAMRELLSDPYRDPNTLVCSDVVKKQVASLQKVSMGEGVMNLFSALADASIGFDVKANYVNTKLLPRLRFLEGRDRRMTPSLDVEEVELSGEDEEDEYTPHRAPEQESEGVPIEAIATMKPFFGGYVMDAVYDGYDSTTLTWKTTSRTFSELPQQEIDEVRKRTYRSRVKVGQGAVKLPRGWGADRSRVHWEGEAPKAWKLEVDQNGIVRLRTDEEISTMFSVEIGPTSDVISLAPPSGEVPQISDRFPEELLTATRAILNESISGSAKMRKLASLIHGHLEYDKDIQWEAVYKADPSAYFEKIWEHKKAKCDEANTFLVRLLTKAGFHARFMGGHSVRQKSEQGEAMLLESNRHAWSAGWDAEVGEWIRLDATPAGDPNVDQEEQQEELGEGDYGEQEAELMSNEELEKRLAELEKEEEDRREREDPVLAYAREAECSPEEARDVLKKIERLRKDHAEVLADADRQWQTLVRKNKRERVVDRGPVPLSQMDEIDPDELVAGVIEMRAGSRDPLIGMKDAKEMKTEKWFGGYEVYIAADLSGSMSETMDGVVKSEVQRDMAFLLVDSCMQASVRAKQAERSLKAPMPVKVSVVTFGEETEPALPLTEDWTPAEQVRLYRALAVAAKGGTPDHLALQMIQTQITDSVKQEEASRTRDARLKKNGWKTRRFVITTADGGSDSSRNVKQANDRLKEASIPVDLLLIGSEENTNLIQAAERVYQSVTPVQDVRDLAKKGLARLTERIRMAYKT